MLFGSYSIINADMPMSLYWDVEWHIALEDAFNTTQQKIVKDNRALFCLDF